MKILVDELPYFSMECPFYWGPNECLDKDTLDCPLCIKYHTHDTPALIFKKNECKYFIKIN